MSGKTYEEIGRDIGRLVQEKNQAYGSSFDKAGDVMRILYPDGITSEKLDDALTVVRVLDKLFRIATDRDALGESPWRDVAGYSILSVKRVEAGREAKVDPARIGDCVRCTARDVEVSTGGICFRCFTVQECEHQWRPRIIHTYECHTCKEVRYPRCVRCHEAIPGTTLDSLCVKCAEIFGAHVEEDVEAYLQNREKKT